MDREFWEVTIGHKTHNVPPPIGRLLTADDVAHEIFADKRTARWVRENLNQPTHGRLRLGHNTVFWEEYTLRRWILQQVGGD